MIGLKFHRLKNRLKQGEVAEKAGIAMETVYRLEKGIPETTPSATISALANALGVTMDEIIREYSNTAVKAGDHPTKPSATECESNCITQYRRAKNLTFLELAELLENSSREAGRLACRREVASPKHVRLLAAHEGISVEKFYQIYGYDQKAGAAA